MCRFLNDECTADGEQMFGNVLTPQRGSNAGLDNAETSKGT